jgi:ketosteroid isomerase-like protein
MISGDMDRWITLWDENGVQMPPDTPMRIGRAAILEEMKRSLEGVSYDTFTINLDETTMDDRIGFSSGTFTYSFIRKTGGGRNHREGKYLTIFRRQPDGSFKIYRDCFNFNAPPAA